MRTMAANPGAKFSPKTYRLVAERAKTDPGLQESLISRDDLTQVITCQLQPFLSEELKARLRALDAPPEGGSLLDSLTVIASESERKAQERKERAAVYSLIEQVRAGTANASVETIRLANAGDVTALTHFLAGIAQLPDQTISTSLGNANGMPLAVTLRGLGLNPTLPRPSASCAASASTSPSRKSTSGLRATERSGFATQNVRCTCCAKRKAPPPPPRRPNQRACGPFAVARAWSGEVEPTSPAQSAPAVGFGSYNSNPPSCDTG